MAGEINYKAVLYWIKCSKRIIHNKNWQYTKTHIVHGATNSLLEGEPWGGVWLQCMPVKWYGVAYEQKKVVWQMPRQPHCFGRPCMLFSPLTYSLPLNSIYSIAHTIMLRMYIRTRVLNSHTYTSVV